MIVREFSMAGPCVTFGRKLVRETAKFYVFEDQHGKQGRISKANAHVEPCPSCRDHSRTQYPNGYMD